MLLWYSSKGANMDKVKTGERGRNRWRNTINS
jgi:hypothetical protein